MPCAFIIKVKKSSWVVCDGCEGNNNSDSNEQKKTIRTYSKASPKHVRGRGREKGPGIVERSNRRLPCISHRLTQRVRREAACFVLVFFYIFGPSRCRCGSSIGSSTTDKLPCRKGGKIIKKPLADTCRSR